MKTRFVITMLLAVLLLSSCVSTKNESVDPIGEELMAFSSNFGKLIIGQNYNEALNSFDPMYRKEQLETNLNNNVDQFLCEFLSCFDGENNVVINDLTTIEIFNPFEFIEIDVNAYVVTVQVILKDGTEYFKNFDVFVDVDGSLYFVGALG